ncbi:hypothetical protein EVAR_64734_1 [Eumeta japonica]|uniref:Uncharacterized protein n=1 Tax=Eumeta variegata TaxID=151549 RepID=A0A4C1Z3N5_EUMVA|nr:hypothetical protein EVAR_64734_1 [Eumeta japonica]
MWPAAGTERPRFDIGAARGRPYRKKSLPSPASQCVSFYEWDFFPPPDRVKYVLSFLGRCDVHSFSECRRSRARLDRNPTVSASG